MSLRSAVPADTSAIALLVQETIGSIYPRYYPDSIVDAFARMHSHDAISTDVAAGRVTVAEMAGKIIGTGTVDGNHISRLFVLPAFQGRGVGSALLDRLEGKIARTCDVAVVESSSAHDARCTSIVATRPSPMARGRCLQVCFLRQFSFGK